LYNPADISDRIKQAAKANGIPMKKLLENVNLGASTMNNMKNSVPKADNLAKIADYLDCSVDYLLGREAEKSTLSATPDERQLLDGYRQLNQQGKEHILQTIDMARSVYTKNTESPSIEQETNAG